MDRSSFLVSTLASLVAPAVPTPSSQPADWDAWDRSPNLPYNQPLELKMELLDAGSERLVLTHYRGRPVILNIFATWCGPCNHEQPYLVEAAQRYADAGLVVIGIDSQEHDDYVRDYRKKYSITYPIAMDRHGSFRQSIEVGATGQEELYPFTLFITPRGFLYGLVKGGMSKDELNYRIVRFLAAVSQEMQTPRPSALPSPG